MTGLTPEEQPFVGPIRRAGIATSWAGLTGTMGIDFHGHTRRSQGFVGDVAMQLSKGPPGCVPVRFALLLAGPFPVLAFRAISNVGQVFQSDDALGMLLHNPTTDEVVAILFQPSLSSCYRHQTTGRRASAFVLQAFRQPRIMVSFGTNLFARIEGGAILDGSRHSQVALSYVYPNHPSLGFGKRVCYLNLQGHQVWQRRCEHHAG